MALALLASSAVLAADREAPTRGAMDAPLASSVALLDASPGGAESVCFADIPSVLAVSECDQALTEAPSDGSIVTEEEIRDFGDRTLGALLASRPGSSSPTTAPSPMPGSASADFVQVAIRQDGRTVWLELDDRFGWP